MIRSLMGLFGRGSERVTPPRRVALGLESLDGRVMPSAVIATPAMVPGAVHVQTVGSHQGEGGPTVLRNAGEEIPS
jgi:hypothetical protein